MKIILGVLSSVISSAASLMVLSKIAKGEIIQSGYLKKHLGKRQFFTAVDKLWILGYKQLEGLRTQNALTHAVQEYVWVYQNFFSETAIGDFTCSTLFTNLTEIVTAVHSCWLISMTICTIGAVQTVCFNTLTSIMCLQNVPNSFSILINTL